VGKARGRASVDIAGRVLSELGYRVMGVNEPVRVEGEEVGEVDLIVEDSDGVGYAVEVKAGRLDVSGVRQAKVNAELLGLRPMVVARGFADDSARVLAERLGVKVINLPDLIATEETELYSIVKEAAREVLLEFLSSLAVLEDEDGLKIISALAESSDLEDACSRLGVSLRELEASIGKLRKGGLLPPTRRYEDLRNYARAIVILSRIVGRTEARGSST